MRSLVAAMSLSALVVNGAACGSAVPDARSLAMASHDPTPLAKCHIAANASAPLVTEWPASEKSHLETLVLSQAVAVAYSGCELRLIDACRLPGTYAWQRTTLATDTVEINDADDLYAKLPLGAISLEGELKRSGRLAVRTTVAGQLRLGAIDTSTVPREGACAHATHVIGAISIGAFKLLGGGSTRASASGSYAGVGGGGQSSHEEQILREAGDPKACAEASAESTSASCSSPIQIFLQPIERTKTDEEKRLEAAEREAERTGVRVSFAAPPDRASWSLRDSADQLVCKLPCARWIGPGSGLRVRQDESATSLEVPRAFDAAPGAALEGRVEPARGTRIGALAALVASAGVAIGGAAFAFADNKRVCFEETHGKTPLTVEATSSCPSSYFPGDAGTERPVGVGVAAMGLGIAGVAAATYWFFWSHGDRIDFRPGAGASSGSSRPLLRVGPLGASGAF